MDAVAEGVVITQTNGGRPVWRLAARQLVSEGETLRVMDYSVEFFDRGGKVMSTLVASEGLLDGPTGDMYSWGDVVVDGSEGDRLVTSSLRWVNAKRLIVTDDPVRITKDDRIIEGVGLEANDQLTRIVILSDVRGEGSDEAIGQ